MKQRYDTTSIGKAKATADNSGRGHQGFELDEDKKKVFDMALEQLRQDSTGESMQLAAGIGQRSKSIYDRLIGNTYMTQDERRQLSNELLSYNADLKRLKFYGYDVDGMIDAGKQFDDVMSQKSRIYGQYPSEMDYNRDVLNGGVYEDGSEARGEVYQRNRERMSELEKILTNGKNSTAQEELEALRMMNAAYERGMKVTDDYRQNTRESDFAQRSKQRDYGNATQEYAEEYRRRFDPDTISYDPVAGGLVNELGEIVNEDLYAKYAEPVVNDKLGAYLSGDPEHSRLQKTNGAANALDEAVAEGDELGWQYLTEDEIGIYYYLYSKNGKDAAEKYLKDMQVTLSRRAEDDFRDTIAASGNWRLALFNAASVPMNVVGGTAEGINYLVQQAAGNMDDYNPYNSFTRQAGIIRGETSQRIDDAAGNANLFGFSLGDAYQAMMSGADSALGAAIGGHAYTVMMGTSAASAEATRLWEAGASKDQILAGSLTAGAAETIFEYISLDHFLNLKSPETMKNVVINILAQGGVEASEEIATEISNTITNTLIMGSQSDLKKGISELTAQGYSEAQAAALYICQNLWESGMGGFVSGAAMAAPSSIAGYTGNQAYYRAEGRDIQRMDGTQALKDLANQVAAENIAGQDRAGKKDRETLLKAIDRAEKKESSRNIGYLSHRVDQSRQTQNRESLKNALKKDAGMTEKEAAKAAEIINAAAEMNADEAALKSYRDLMENEKVASVIDTVYGETGQITDRNTRHLAGRMGLELTEDSAEVQHQYTVSDTGEAFLRSNGENIQSMEAVEKNGTTMMKVKTEEGTQYVPPSEVSFASEDQAVMFQKFSEMDIAPSSIVPLMEGYNGNDRNLTAYVLGVQEAYTYGKHNMSMDRGTFVNDLTEEQRLNAYQRGQMDATKSVAMAEAKILEGRKKSKQKSKSNSGGTVYEFDRSSLELTPMQKQSAFALEKLGNTLGVTFHLYQSTQNADGSFVMEAENGQISAPNGYYKNGEIYIDINAGMDGKGTMLFTAAHELTHMVKDWSPAKYKSLSDFLVENYQENGQSVEELVRLQQKKAENNGRSISYNEAFDEVIADSMESMLADGKAMEKMAELKVKDETLWKKIRNWWAEFTAKIRKLYAGLNPDSLEGRMVKEMTDAAEKLKQMFAEGVVEASDNRNPVRNSSMPASSTKLSSRFHGGDLDLTAGDGVSSKEMRMTSSERSDIWRQVANKTSEIEEGRKKRIVVYTSNHIWYIVADGYNKGNVVMKEAIAPGISQITSKKVKAFLNGTDTDGKMDNAVSSDNESKRGYGGIRSDSFAEGGTDAGTYEDDGYESRILDEYDVRATGEGYYKLYDKDTGEYVGMHGGSGSIGDGEKRIEKNTTEGGVKYSERTRTDDKIRWAERHEWVIYDAVQNALDHGDTGDDNLIEIGEMPPHIAELSGVKGIFYVYRDHLYENMVSIDRALSEHRKTERYGKKIDFHNLGAERINSALLSLNAPLFTIAETGRDGNPELSMVLPVNDENGNPLYAVFGLFENRKINGGYSTRPHIVLTISQREMWNKNLSASEGRGMTTENAIEKAKKDGRLLDVDIKNRDDYAVTAQTSNLGGISQASLNANVSRFKEKVKGFLAETGKKSERFSSSSGTRGMLGNLDASTVKNDIERKRLIEYQQVQKQLTQQQKRAQVLREDLRELRSGRGKRSLGSIRTLQEELTKTQNRMDILSGKMMRMEDSTPLKRIAERERKAAERDNVLALREALTAQKRQLQAKTEERLTALRKELTAQKKEAIREARADTRTKEHEKANDRVNRLKETAKTRKTKAEIKGKIQKLTKDLQGRLDHPKEGKYVPRELVSATVDILNAINMDSGRSENLTEKLAMLKLRYEAMKNQPEYAMAYDSFYEDLLSGMVKQIGNTSVSQMSVEQLETVHDVLKALHEGIRTANKVTIQGEERDAYQAATELIEETKTTKGGDGPVARWNNASLRPETMFERFAGFKKNSTWGKLYRVLDEGQLKSTRIIMEGSGIFEELAFDSRNLKNMRSMVDIGLKDEDGKTVEISRGMMLSIAMHMGNEQNRNHIIYGGLTVPELKNYYKGNVGDAFGIGHVTVHGFSSEISRLQQELSHAETVEQQETIKAEIEEVHGKAEAFGDTISNAIEKELTDYERKWLDKSREFFDRFSKFYLNEATMEMYHFQKAKVDGYFPIRTDPNYRDASFESIVRDMSLENSGFMKDRVQGAKNPIILEDISDVVNSQLKRTASYCGLAPAIRTFQKVYSKSQRGYVGSVQDTLASKFGKEGKQWVENLLADLTGSRHTQNTVFDRLRGNMAAATLTMNPRVALAQAASYPTAAAELGYKPLEKALRRGGKNSSVISGADQELIMKYSPLLWYRMQGYSNVELGDIRSSQELMGKVNRKLRWAMGWIQAVDGATVGRLWYATQYYVDDHYKHLEKGSDEYYRKVAEVFNRVVEKTQPNYTVMQRPDILRNPNAILRQLTMFMTQRLQNYGIMYEAVARYNKYKQDFKAGINEVTQADISEARNTAIRSISSQVAANLTIVAFKALADLLTHSFNGYRDEEEEVTGKSISLALLDSFANSVVSSFLWGSELYSLVSAAVNGRTYDGLTVNAVDILTEAINSLLNVSKKLKDPEKSLGIKDFYKVGAAIANALGIPANNAYKIGRGLYYNFSGIANGDFIDIGLERTASQNGELLYLAMLAGDKDRIERFSSTFDDDRSLHKAIRDQLREKDERIRMAAEARYAGNMGEYTRLVKEIKAEGIFIQDDIVAAVNTVLNQLDKTAEEKKDHSSPNMYQQGDYLLAVEAGQTDTAREIRDTMISGYISDGKSPTEAEKAFYSSVRSSVKEAFKEGEYTTGKAISTLERYGGLTLEEATSRVQKWEFDRDYPGYEWTEKQISNYKELVKPAGISVSVYDEYLNGYYRLSGDGKREQVAEMIQSLPISNDQKDVLYLLTYKEKYLYQTPWH